MNMDDDNARYLPTEEEIRRICKEEIQPAWDKKERTKRECGSDKPVEWQLPVIGLLDIDGITEDTLDCADSIVDGG
jgi:hypothetical protein